VCPYHGWTYALDGRLLHLPKAEVFEGACADELGLVALPTVERHGFVWVLPTPDGALDLDAHLGTIGAELDAFALADYRLFRRVSAVRRTNWKLIAENFLEAYHVRQLHRESIYPFFIDSLFAIERAGLHQRAAVGRRPAEVADERPLLDLVTMTYFLFPCTVVVVHADYVDLMSFTPIAVDQVAWHHALLCPSARAGERDFYERAFRMMDERVFNAEDLRIVEEVQAGLSGGVVERLLFGGLEHGPVWFHESVDAALAEKERA
jgi:phenylpropionate dioxygenase-like ring-hydroxylating dioxygenase large terminal subunit